MLRLLNLALMRGTRLLYAHTNLIASPGERIGLVGPNGCGKSTLFTAILGDLAPEDGELETPPHERIAHVAQSFTVEDISCIDCVLSGHAPLMNAKAALERAEASGDEMALAAAHSELAEVNEGAVVAQAKAILAGLGFAEADSCRKVHDFSGGWRNRIQLARALMRPADLLLLDEPTNHLDIDSLIWLENWLRRVEATVIIISHDREFLDRAVNTIWSVEDGTICRYAGNYSQFELARIEKLRAQESARRAYETQAAHLTSFIERFRAKATKARQAQSRIKMLEKLQAVEPVRAKREWRFNFLKPLRLPEHLVDGENLKIGYGDKVVLSGVSFSIRSGERIGILGVNGAGKSTLVKAIVGELTPMSGELRRGQGLEIGYFAQHQLDQLRMDETPLEHLRHLGPDAREQELRDFLGTYRFSGDFAEAKVAPMSGGEKARLALALIAWKKPNLLVLDEPTNHLDMETREALTMALSTYEGAVLLVSHDRHLLRAVTDELWLVHEGRKEVFEGDLDDYAKIVLDHRRVTAAEARAEHQADKAARNEAQPVNNKEARRLAAQERARIAELRKPLKKELEKVEREMNALSEKLKALDTQLADPAFYNGADQGKVAQTLREHGELAPKVEALEMHWLELSEKIEALGTAASA
ncbi:ABC-F family ATP-binding cassette domain-containing protein [Sutterella wadsworthensis]|uniref:ABC-F family ATP-binding cassette domain-containing protein n=1 Tax=Sutterella wadsworthensis TaxID=40545 RepID=UPI001C013B45|nr:ATP-binding cassette domain-containing protein [Sutterella wadsworthensis]MBT9621582.1 ATP-binding cassette domain-containing protein [Sutterella wadsworthensis]